MRKPVRYYIYLLIITLFFVTIIYFYLSNLTRDVYAGDIGDLASAAALFGVPHPPGYPTLTMLGFIFSRLPLPLPIISRIALVSLCSAFFGSVVYFFFILKLIHYDTSMYHSVVKSNIKKIKFRIFDIGADKLIVAILSTAFLAFSYYYWLYAEVPEVFALSNFFLISMYFTAYLFYKTKRLHFLYLTSFIVGLAMTNQQAIMLSFPGLIVMVGPDLWGIFKRKKTKIISHSGLSRIDSGVSAGRRIPRMTILRNIIIGFIVGLLPYVYVFISASTRPQINWMKESTVYNFIRLILRMDYSFFQNPVGVDQRLILLGIYYSTLITTFSIIITLVCILGMLQLFRMNRRIFWAIMTGYIFAGPIFIFVITPEIVNADEIGVVERMFTQSFVLFLFFLPFGFIAIQRLFVKLLRRKLYAIIFLLPFIIIVIQMIYYNQEKTNLSQTKIGSNFVYDILSPLPKNSIIFLTGDSGTLNSWYVHYVEKFRSDVIFVGSFGDRNDFENRIIADFKKKNPDTKLKDEVIMIKTFPNILKTRDIYSMYIFPLGNKDYFWMPLGLVNKLTLISHIPTEEEYIKFVNNITGQYHVAFREKLLPSEQNNIVPNMSEQYSNAYNSFGDFLYVQYGNKSKAYNFYKMAEKIDPQNPSVFAKLGIIQAEMPDQCKQAVNNIETAIKMLKIQKPYYTFALRIYQKCNVPQKKVSNLKFAYKKLFGKELEKDLHY
jgi:hypothetical protein